MAEYLTRDEYRILQTYFLPGIREWRFTNVVTSIHRYRLVHVIAQNFLVTLNLLSYDARDRLGEQIEVTPDAL
jgi:hypothetical protein